MSKVYSICLVRDWEYFFFSVYYLGIVDKVRDGKGIIAWYSPPFLHNIHRSCPPAPATVSTSKIKEGVCSRLLFFGVLVTFFVLEETKK
jgi:hypothetical protein